MKLHANIKNCVKGKLSAGIGLLHDNTKPHRAGQKQSKLMKLKFEVLVHPVYNPDLSPCGYEVFGMLKKFLEGKCSSIDQEVKKVVKEWILQVGAEFWRRWQKYIDIDGD